MLCDTHYRSWVVGLPGLFNHPMGQKRGVRGPRRAPQLLGPGAGPQGRGDGLAGSRGLQAEHTQALCFRGRGSVAQTAPFPGPPAQRGDRLGAGSTQTQVCPHAHRYPLSASRPGQLGATLLAPDPEACCSPQRPVCPPRAAMTGHPGAGASPASLAPHSRPA